MVNQLLKMSENIIKPTDRDSFAFKRIDLSGFLLAGLFREYYEEGQFTIENGFMKGMRGNWGLKMIQQK